MRMYREADVDEFIYLRVWTNGRAYVKQEMSEIFIKDGEFIAQTSDFKLLLERIDKFH
jgi:hypothetical protein